MKDLFRIFFSNNPKLSKMRELIEDVAKTDVTLLIRGEQGSGKELVARAIHFSSPRRGKPLIKVNCAAVPHTLLENELFGHERGAFTGAHLRKPGKFELANEGTILLSEVGEMNISIQAKLLQVLQDGEFSRLGGDGDIAVNSRVIATTKDDLERAIVEGRFRDDLFYRINVINILVPPLRERRDQIVPLSRYFFGVYREKYKRMVPSLSFMTLSTFKDYDWPGNIRELENMIKRIVLLNEEEAVLQELARERSRDKRTIETANVNGLNAYREIGSLDLRKVAKSAAEKAERELIQKALHETRWNRKEASRLLRISYKALLLKIQKYQLDSPVERSVDGGETEWKPRMQEFKKELHQDWAEF